MNRFFNSFFLYLFLIVIGNILPVTAYSAVVQRQNVPNSYQYRQRITVPGSGYEINNYYNQRAYPPGYGYGYAPYGYGYGSLPPPTYDQAFPDDAAADALYRELQRR